MGKLQNSSGLLPYQSLAGTGIGHTYTEGIHKDSTAYTFFDTFHTVCCQIQVGTLRTDWGHTRLLHFEHMNRIGIGCHRVGTLQFPLLRIDPSHSHSHSHSIVPVHSHNIDPDKSRQDKLNSMQTKRNSTEQHQKVIL